MRSTETTEIEETLPLLRRQPSETKAKVLALGAEYLACFLVAFPTAFLNGLAAVSANSTAASNLHTINDLEKLLSEASPSRIAYGLVALSASEAVLFFLNKRYLLASGKAVVNLLKKLIFSLRSLLCRHELGAQDRIGFLESMLFLWSIATSLIFAELGGKALSFMGLSGEIVGFSLSLSVYMATRFASANMFTSNLLDKNWRLKQHYLAKLELLQQNDVDIHIDVETNNNTNHALEQFLSRVDLEWENLPKDKKRLFFLKYVSPLLGYTLTAITVLPIMSGLIPDSVQGAELLAHTTIGANSHYQNAGSFAFGIFATVLTLFFYELNIKNLPKYFLRTALSIYEKIKHGDMNAAIKLFCLTVLAFGASYLTGIGFEFAAVTALASGYFSYLGSWLSKMIPDGLLIAVVAMLWSHLQDLINKTVKLTPNIDVLTKVSLTNATALLEKSDTNIMLLSNNQNTFFPPAPLLVPVSINNEQSEQNRKILPSNRS